MKTMADRIKEMRKLMYNKLRQKKTEGKWTHILEQIGMFSFTGLTRKQTLYGFFFGLFFLFATKLLF